MPIEYEAKVLDVDPGAKHREILDKGGAPIGAYEQRRYVYDITPGDHTKWIRLRDDGDKVTLTVKQIAHDGIDGTHEEEVEVDDFEATNALLELMGFKAKAYQENRRESYVLDGARLEVDQWPLIPPYMEIEAESKEEVERIASLLGYSEDQLTGENTTKVYARYGIDLNEIKDLRF